MRFRGWKRILSEKHFKVLHNKDKRITPNRCKSETFYPFCNNVSFISHTCSKFHHQRVARKTAAVSQNARSRKPNTSGTSGGRFRLHNLLYFAMRHVQPSIRTEPQACVYVAIVDNGCGFVSMASTLFARTQCRGKLLIFR